MLLLLSPSKTIDFVSPVPADVPATDTMFAKESVGIMRQLGAFSIEDIMERDRVSRKIAQATYEYIHTFLAGRSAGKQAVLAFNGNAYDKLNANGLLPSQRDFLQQHLLIFSALYGVLRPLDIICPYRLDMGSGLVSGLYDFWKKKVTQAVVRHAKQGGGMIVNLASAEYFGMLDGKMLLQNKMQVITPVFKQELRGRLTINSLFAKQARGLMTRFIAENGITDPGYLQAFDKEGYFFHPGYSTSDVWVFIR
jgi:cytoplasmic iron level regulating protein YaaA (DUF328/UPF0246 family)